MKIGIAPRKLYRRLLGLGAAVLVVVAVIVWSVSIRWQFVSAAKTGDIATVRRMLDAGMDPDIVSHIGGIRAISFAAYSGHTDVVRLLLDRGSNPTYGLPQAVLMKRTEVARLLIERGADVQRWEGYSSTPLEFAQNGGDEAMVDLLKSAGAR